LIGTGGLFHVLQDQCGFFHSLEGEEGCSQWILDELLPKPPNCLATPTSLLKEECPEITLSEYRPRLLGTGVEEVCFHLYQRYRQVKSLNRKRLVPLVQACYRGDKLAEREIRRSIALSVAELTCDVITTIYCVATSHFSNSGLKQLARVSLTELKPINYPRHAAAPYRFNTLVRNYSLGPDGKKHPLALMLKTGGKMRERRFSEGIGLGTHRESVLTYAVPKRVFRKFHGYFGLHSSLGKEGQVELEVRFRGKREIKQLLNRNQPAVEINLTVTSGGLLEFITRSREGVRGINNNLVLAEPLLVK
ncbi:MAG TPA: NPCBM/NEW2 domain-containing protein, partial [bacterium]|nr:NPCBM/NEW2 domain-containing protein [bacterium]